MLLMSTIGRQSDDNPWQRKRGAGVWFYEDFAFLDPVRCRRKDFATGRDQFLVGKRVGFQRDLGTIGNTINVAY
jgi:hypothetical protein